MGSVTRQYHAVSNAKARSDHHEPGDDRLDPLVGHIGLCQEQRERATLTTNLLHQRLMLRANKGRAAANLKTMQWCPALWADTASVPTGLKPSGMGPAAGHQLA